MELCCVSSWVVLALATLSLVQLLSYLLPLFSSIFLTSQPNLKSKYNAEWALVTGGSSGIGLAIVEKLADQGINVVVVALKDTVFDQAKLALAEKYPKLQFRFVEADLSSPSTKYMDNIKRETKNLVVPLVFNNAGYMVTGFFDQNDIEKHVKNVECNSLAAVRITHHFLSVLLDRGEKGCFVYTSSAAAFIPSPFSALYGASKAFLSSFAASLAVENQARGVDFVAVHPSPVKSRFYDKAHDMEVLAMAKKTAVLPQELPERIFQAIQAKVVWQDIGAFAVLLRVAMSLVAFNFASVLFAKGAKFMPDFKRYNDRKTGGKKAQ